MEIEQRVESGVLVLRPVADHLDAENADDLKSAAKSLITGSAPVVLELSALEFIDSSGVGSILSCLRQARSLGTQLAVSEPGAQLLLAFELLRLDRAMDVYDSTADAVGALLS
jgi:anti-sigma B factor antagonist